MLHTTLLRWLKRGSGSGRRNRDRRHRPPPRPPSVPRLLVLEGRTLPSTLTVLTSADGGDASLRAAIAAAQDGDRIVFDPGLRGQAITLTGGELPITKSLDIEGPGADQLAVSGNHASRVFRVSGDVTVTIAGLTLRDGRLVTTGATDGGGAILNTSTTSRSATTGRSVVPGTRPAPSPAPGSAGGWGIRSPTSTKECQEGGGARPQSRAWFGRDRFPRLVEGPLERVLHPEQLDEVRPGCADSTHRAPLPHSGGGSQGGTHRRAVGSARGSGRPARGGPADPGETDRAGIGTAEGVRP
jgi:hypothetical protein